MLTRYFPAGKPLSRGTEYFPPEIAAPPDVVPFSTGWNPTLPFSRGAPLTVTAPEMACRPSGSLPQPQISVSHAQAIADNIVLLPADRKALDIGIPQARNQTARLKVIL